MADERAPVTLSGFELIEQIGAGGMATVWKARQVSLDRLVAIKFLAPGLADDPADVQRFVVEAQSTARLRHSSIVRIYDAGFEEGHYYFVMEFVDGETVGQWVRRQGRLEERNALLVANAVANALSYAWNEDKIVHCDIKPDNILVDSEGAVKVADLGLARSVRQIGAETFEAEVAGTPWFMSPEQTRGVADLDFRTDIYSIGATLYRLVTGRMLFQGEPESQVMALHNTGHVEDPYGTDLGLSLRICCLIEKMLVKDREGRYHHWDEVIEDITRVKKGQNPAGPFPAPGSSSMNLGEERRKAMKAAHLTSDTKVHPAVWIVALAAVGGLALATALFLSKSGLGEKSPPDPPPSTAQSGETPGPEPAPPAESEEARRTRLLYEETEAWAASNPDALEEGIAKWRKVAEEAAGSRWVRRAEAQAGEWEANLNRKIAAAVAAVVEGLDSKAAPLVESGAYLEAAALYEEYDGPYAAETLQARTVKAAGWRSRLSDIEAAKRKKQEMREQALQRSIARTADAIMAGELNTAQEIAAKAGRGADLADQWKALGQTLREAASADEAVVAWFNARLGRRVTLTLKHGEEPKTIFIKKVEGSLVSGDHAYQVQGGLVSTPINFDLADLPPSDRLRCMGTMTPETTALIKGLMALEARSFVLAEENLSQTHPLIGKALSARVAERAGVAQEEDAKEVFVRMIRSLGIEADPSDPDRLVTAIRKTTFNAARARAAVNGTRTYRSRYGKTRFARTVEEALDALSGARAEEAARPTPTPTAALIPIEYADMVDDGDAVVRKLRSLNPDIENYQVRWHPGEGGKPYSLSIQSRGITDLAPLVALRSLRVLHIGTDGGHGSKLKDLSALRGLALTELHIERCGIRDLSVLRGMPLRSLSVARTSVRDLAPLRGAPLEVVDISDTTITDLAPLVESPVRELVVNRTQIRSISLAKQWKLEHLEMAGSRITDFSALQGMPLTHLDLTDTQFSRTHVLKGMQLQTLLLGGTKAADLSPLVGMPLEHLSIQGCPVRSFAPIRDLPLKAFHAGSTSFKDLSLLQGKQLEELGLNSTAISDLKVIEGMPLTVLSIRDTKVRDLAPLRGMALTFFDGRELKVRDFSVLRGMPIKDVRVDDADHLGNVMGTWEKPYKVNGETQWQ